MKPTLFALLFVLFSQFSQAKVQVLFHPHDPTLEQIADWIEQAHSSVDIAMYNIDIANTSPVIAKIKSPEIQKRLASGNLKIRMIFEGYGTAATNAAKMQEIEDLGIDVRFLKKSVKVHHKFAAIDTGLQNPRVISGSANWSLGSYRNYNENILFFEQEDEASYRFQLEFNRLWEVAKEFGSSRGYTTPLPLQYQDTQDFEVYFNSPRTIDHSSTEETVLTEQIVRAIQSAQTEIQIASTRIRLVPVLEALKEAADRGVKIKALISQDDYADIYTRTKYLLKNPNLELRVKFYNLRVPDYIVFQMHNKFMIVDQKQILTGSFNWSDSSENKHIENLMSLSGSVAQEVQLSFQNEFSMLWDLGRDQYQPLVEKLQGLLDAGEATPCPISAMSLDVKEIYQLLKLSPSCQKRAPKVN